MKLNIKIEKLKLTPAIKDYLEKKIAVLEKFINTDTGNLIAHAIVGKTTNHHHKGNHFKAEIKINAPHKNFIAKAQRDDLYAAIDEVQDILKREIVKHKEILIDKHQQGGDNVSS